MPDNFGFAMHQSQLPKPILAAIGIVELSLL
jgi:hypothetical protein